MFNSLLYEKMMIKIILAMALVSIAACSSQLPKPSILTTTNEKFFNGQKVGGFDEVTDELNQLKLNNEKLNVITCVNGSHELYLTALDFVAKLGITNLHLWSSYNGKECSGQSD